MPLPIPDILQNASKALELAKKVAESDHTDSGGPSEYVVELREALKKVNPDDLLAVMNEVGKVYLGLHNIQMLQIGSRSNIQEKTLEISIIVEYGLGPRTLTVALPIPSATQLVKQFSDNLAIASIDAGRLITDVGNA